MGGPNVPFRVVQFSETFSFYFVGHLRVLHSQLLTICVELMASLPCAPPLSGNPSDTRHSTQDQRSQAPSTQDSGTGDSVDETLTMSQPREPPAPLHPSQIRQRSGLMVEVGGTPTGSQRTPQSEGGGGDDAGSSIGSNTSASASASSSRGSTASLTMSESVLNRIQARRNQKGRGAALSPWYKCEEYCPPKVVFCALCCACWLESFDHPHMCLCVCCPHMGGCV